ncbi:unnamed protein product [Brassica oleracea]
MGLISQQPKPIQTRAEFLLDSTKISLGVKPVLRGQLASRIIAQFIVMGSGILGRAFFQAYRQAIANASKTGVAQEAMQNAVRKAGKAINAQEARQILGVTEQTSWEEILLKYDKLFENNAKAGSFYLQSKVVRAKECLEVVHRTKAN